MYLVILLRSFVVAGGVAANETIRKNLKEISKKMNFKPIFPSKEFCGDNAAMIAWAGIQRFKKSLIQKNEIVKSRWPLDKNAPFLKGTRIKILMEYWLIKSEPDVWSLDDQKKLVVKDQFGMVLEITKLQII